VPCAAEHAFPLYSVADAEHLRLHLQGLLLAAMGDGAAREPGSIDVVVVGGGPTGVETTGALAHLMLALHKSGDWRCQGRITLIDLGDALLGQFSDKAHGYPLKKLTEGGAEVRLGVGVTSIHPDRVQLNDGTTMTTRTVVWGGGRVRICGRPDSRTVPRSRWPPRRPPGPHCGRLPRCLCRGRRPGQFSDDLLLLLRRART
jgi:NADH:ubiquinone reductase (H+-translocating)